MFISIVVPTYNRGRKLSLCLEPLLAQDYSDYEMILSDDGSTDNTAEIAARYPCVIYIRQENHGPASACNHGIARGQAVAFTDDDCRVPKDWLARLAEGLARYPQVAGVGGYLDPPEEVVTRNLFARYERFVTTLHRQGTTEYVGGLEDYPAGGTSNICYRKSVLDQVGGFDEWFPYPAAEDHDLRVRVQSLGYPLLYLPLRVEHLRSYSWHSFWQQSIVRGRGFIRWEYKSNRQRLTGYSRIGLRFIKRALRILPDLITFSDRRMALIHCLGNCIDAYGQFLERRDLARR